MLDELLQVGTGISFRTLIFFCLSIRPSSESVHQNKFEISHVPKEKNRWDKIRKSGGPVY